MNTKIYLFLLSFLFIGLSFSLHGQKQVVPGYQGKRILLGVYYNFISDFYGPNSNGKHWSGDYRNSEESLQPTAFSGRFDLTASYVINRRLTGTFSTGFGQTGITENGLINTSTSIDDTNYGLFKMGYAFAAVGLQIQRKKRWGIAPIGPYWGVRYIASKSYKPKLLMTSKQRSFNYVPIDQCDCTWEIAPPESTTTSIQDSKIFHNFEIQFGIRNIIKKHYFYDMAFTTVPLGWDANSYSDLHPIDARLKTLYAFNLRIGVGMLF